MRSSLLCAIMFGAAIVTGPAGAWLLYPDKADPRHMIVEVERATGDLVPLVALPPPFGTAMGYSGGPDKLTFRWRYGRDAEGAGELLVDGDGRGEMRFDFAARPELDDRRFGAAAVLVGKQGTPLHTFYARADLSRGLFPDSTLRHNVTLAVDRPLDWWQEVEAIAFFSMTYYPLQKLDDEGVWRAMRRAVGRFSKGQGTEQRG
ncbi:hypothetical protein [Mesorhizobium sp. 1B3]|uniref:hypothetical protein n=1 Tax=Mesorhizobium sp. 1B3 TaxID=3243599 RepID=UPI003D995139